ELIGKLQKEILQGKRTYNPFNINNIYKRRAFLMPSCPLAHDFAQKSMPKIGKVALILVQFCNPNVIRNLRLRGRAGPGFFNKKPVGVLDNTGIKPVSV